MGWIGHSLGKYRLICHDSSFHPYYTVKKSKEWFDGKHISFEFINLSNGDQNDIEVPLTRFGKLRKLKQNYVIDLYEVLDDVISVIFFEELSKRNIVVEGYLRVVNYHSESQDEYYLKSDLMDDSEIVITSKKERVFSIKNIDEYKWITSKGFDLIK